MSQLKHKFPATLARFILLGLLVALVAGCRPQAAAVLPTAIATLTSVPRSTPLPPLPTSVGVGKTDNPLRLIIHPFAKVSDDTIADIESAIETKTKLSVKIESVDSDAAALDALCSASVDQPALAWLSAGAYVVANAKNCGHPQLLVRRGTGSTASTGAAATIIARRGIDSLTAIDGRIFCRVNNKDTISWFIPSLMMQAAGLKPISDPKTIKDYAKPADLVKAVANSTCDAAAIDEASVKELVTDNTSVSAKVSTVATSVEFPYAILTASSDIPLAALDLLNAEFVRQSKDRLLKPKLAELLGQSSLATVTIADLQPLIEFVASTGQDLTQLGN